MTASSDGTLFKTKGGFFSNANGEDGAHDAGCSSVQRLSRGEEMQWLEWTISSTDKGYYIGLSYEDSDVYGNR
jgi:hypothetical protein